MKLEQYNPYFNDAHDELVEILRILPEHRWDLKPAHVEAPSIRQIALRLIDQERFWVVHIAQQGQWDRVARADFPNCGRVVEGLVASRTATLRYIDFLEPAALKAVREVPAEPALNRAGINQSLAWILWQVMRNDIFALGQVDMRRSD